MRRRKIAFATTTVVLVLSIMAPALATKPGTNPDLIDGHKITICHVTNSATNPYVVITIDIAAWDNEGDERHSPDHHVNRKTGQHDQVWDPVTETCVDETPPTTTTTEPPTGT
ncbi:MAG: hypothetical protein M3P87_03640 [Actinomycetota bacterium]|nr:hypothetical protein [Actinomycetota bacterium]